MLHAKGLHAELAPESERRSEQRKQMNRESKLPKEERTYNFQNRLIEAQQAKLAELEQQTQIQKQLLDETVMQQSIVLGELMMQEDQKEQNDQEITIQQKTITELRTERRKLERVLDSLKDGIIEPLSRFCQQVFLGLKAQQSGQKKDGGILFRYDNERNAHAPATHANKSQNIVEIRRFGTKQNG